jgi:hypothetical protein
VQNNLIITACNSHPDELNVPLINIKEIARKENNIWAVDIYAS